MPCVVRSAWKNVVQNSRIQRIDVAMDFRRVTDAHACRSYILDLSSFNDGRLSDTLNYRVSAHRF